MAVTFNIHRTYDIGAGLTVSGSTDTYTILPVDSPRGFMCELRATAAMTYKASDPNESATVNSANSARILQDTAESIYVPPTGLKLSVTGTGTIYARAIVSA